MMNRRLFLASSALLTTACALPPVATATAQRAGIPAHEWEIGPVIRGRNYSVNMPLHPVSDSQGWYFDFPGPDRRNGHVHYVTRETGSLAGMRGIRLRYRIDAGPETQFVPQEYPDRPPLLSLFIQRAGDDWMARGDTLFHRWYSPRDRIVQVAPGEHELVILFEENWISVMGSDRERSPREFAATLAEAGRIGITFGSRGGRGHGVYATSPARFTMLEFSLI